MFNQQQKPAFKFVIRSRIEENSQKEDAPAAQKQESLTSTSTDDRKRKRADNTTAPIATKKIHSQLQRWNKKKEELKHEREEEDEQEKAKSNFADLSAMACLLCQRKFKSKADLERHQDISELHKKNLNDPVAVSKAKLKLGFSKQVTEQQPEPTVEYRNRAAERRQAYGQPEKPILSPPPPPPRQLAATTRELEAIPKASMNTPISDDNKGARMLQQMGWKKGEGLGKDGTGILNPIRAESYAQSAGIGASTRRDITEGTYRNRTMDLARKRLLEK